MRKILKRLLKLFIPFCPRCARDEYGEKYYSQDGEDAILRNLFPPHYRGFFVDVGAHHPKRFSNTYSFYARGWKGINIDPIPGVKSQFEKVRPDDITLEMGISDQEGVLDYYIFSEPAWNSFEKDNLKTFEERGYPKLLETRRIPVSTLSQVLNNHLPKNQTIDFLSIDAEGWDFKVLQSNNWELYRPKVIVVEDGQDVLSSLHSPIANLLKDKGYKLIAKTQNSAIHTLTT